MLGTPSPTTSSRRLTCGCPPWPAASELRGGHRVEEKEEAAAGVRSCAIYVASVTQCGRWSGTMRCWYSAA
eukprot:COSAG01_NODE_43917_length_424_cov_7.436923_1_plen_70_part_10